MTIKIPKNWGVPHRHKPVVHRHRPHAGKWRYSISNEGMRKGRWKIVDEDGKLVASGVLNKKEATAIAEKMNKEYRDERIADPKIPHHFGKTFGKTLRGEWREEAKSKEDTEEYFLGKDPRKHKDYKYFLGKKKGKA